MKTIPNISDIEYIFHNCAIVSKDVEFLFISLIFAPIEFLRNILSYEILYVLIHVAFFVIRHLNLMKWLRLIILFWHLS